MSLKASQLFYSCSIILCCSNALLRTFKIFGINCQKESQDFLDISNPISLNLDNIFNLHMINSSINIILPDITWEFTKRLI